MFTLNWKPQAFTDYKELEAPAETAVKSRKKNKKGKSSKQEGLFKQVRKALDYLKDNPRHPSLETHEYDSIPHPWNANEKVFEAYAQNKTSGAYRIFWCYGPNEKEITLIAITSHP